MLKPIEKSHATFSASGAKRWLNCPGSIALAQKAPPESDSKSAKEGTDAHHCLEVLLKNHKTMKAYRSLLVKKFPEEMVAHAYAAAEWILQNGAACKILCETKVDSSSFTCEGQFGTVDAAIVDLFVELTVIDFKYGAGIDVPIEDNEQLIYYALGIAHEYDYNFERIKIVILQPRTGDGSPKEQTFEIDEILKWRETFLKGVKVAKRPNAPLKAGSWCQFCKATPICPEVSNRQLEAARVAFDTDLTDLGLPVIKRERLGETLNAIDKLEHWISRVKEFAFSELSHQRKIEGWKLVEKRATRKWADEQKAEARADKLFGSEAWSSKLKSPAQLEKIEDDRALDFVAKNTVYVSSGLTIAPIGDKRPEVTLAQIAFEEKPKIKQKEKKEKIKWLLKQKRKNSRPKRLRLPNLE